MLLLTFSSQHISNSDHRKQELLNQCFPKPYDNNPWTKKSKHHIDRACYSRANVLYAWQLRRTWQEYENGNRTENVSATKETGKNCSGRERRKTRRICRRENFPTYWQETHWEICPSLVLQKFNSTMVLFIVKLSFPFGHGVPEKVQDEH